MSVVKIEIGQLQIQYKAFNVMGCCLLECVRKIEKNAALAFVSFDEVSFECVAHVVRIVVGTSRFAKAVNY